jgi:hypothetical protein
VQWVQHISEALPAFDLHLSTLNNQSSQWLITLKAIVYLKTAR